MCSIYVEKDIFSAIYVMMNTLHEDFAIGAKVSFWIEQQKLLGYLTALARRHEDDQNDGQDDDLLKETQREAVLALIPLIKHCESVEELEEYDAIHLQCMTIINQIRNEHPVAPPSIIKSQPGMEDCVDDHLIRIWMSWNTFSATDRTSSLISEILSPTYPHREAVFVVLSLVSHQLQHKVACGKSMIAAVLGVHAIEDQPFEDQWETLHEHIAAYLDLLIQAQD